MLRQVAAAGTDIANSASTPENTDFAIFFIRITQD
jgi:hypothetical protein